MFSNVNQTVVDTSKSLYPNLTDLPEAIQNQSKNLRSSDQVRAFTEQRLLTE